jgi:hypothetical protein
MKGELVVPCTYDMAYPFTDGLASVCQNGKAGFINTKGEVAIPFIYELAGSFSDGLACVTQKGLQGYINTKGELVIPCIYGLATEFIDGLAVVSNGTGMYLPSSIINKNGTVVVEKCVGGSIDSWARIEVDSVETPVTPQ